MDKKGMKKLTAQGTRIGKLISCQSSLWDSENKEMKMGEAALIMAVITKAIENLPLILSEKEVENREGRSSISFIFSKGFVFDADLIGLNAVYVREKIVKWISQWVGDGGAPLRSLIENILHENRSS